MTTKPLPDAETLRAILDYDPETGVLTWRPRPESMFTTPLAARRWNGRNAGKVAFTAPTTNGYRQGCVFTIRALAHRVIWKMMTGEEAGEEIDHRNGDRSDNRWANLASADSQTNQRNRRKSRRNTSGVTGVYQNDRGAFIANICIDRRTRYIGSYSTLEAAAEARRTFAAQHGFTDRHGL